MPKVTASRLREAIAETLRDSLTRVKIERLLVEDLDLDPLDDPKAHLYTKAVYVDAMLAHLELGQLADIAIRVDAHLQFGAPGLLELVARIGPGGVSGELKNLIFAADGPKPEIVLQDALNNDIRVVKNEQHCLVYDQPLTPAGLTWRELSRWWAQRESITSPEREVWSSLYQRLARSIANDAERRIFSAYGRRYRVYGADIPALIPQVYLHYDPYTRARYGAASGPLTHQRMDFLLLLPNRVRVVIECDGIQHYADSDGRADSKRYAVMAAEDRELRLKGYEVYRFGGADLMDRPETDAMLTTFFDRLAERHAV